MKYKLPTRWAGFTLIEMLITMVLIGILSAIGYSNYRDHVTRSRRSDAQIVLMQIAALQQKFFSECASTDTAGVVTGYTANFGGTIMDPDGPGAARGCTGLGYVPTANAASAFSPDRHYQLGIAAIASLATDFRVTAAPVATSPQAADGAFRIDSLGTKEWDRNNNGTWEATENTWNKN